MQRSSGPLKIISIVCSALLAIAGCILLGFAVTAAQTYKVIGVHSSVIWIITVALAAIGLSCLAVYGAYKENPALLAGLVVMMLAGCVVMVMAGNTTVTSLPQLMMMDMNMDGNQLANQVLSDGRLRSILHTVETENQCCGVLGYTDYMKNNRPIPSSCKCSRGSAGCSPSSSSSSYSDYPYSNRHTDQYGKNDMETTGVYSQWCKRFLMNHLRNDIQERVERVTTCLSVVALVSFLLCSALLLQISGLCDHVSAAPWSGATMSPPLQMQTAAQPLSPASRAWS